MIVKPDLPKLKFLNRFKQPILNGQKTMTLRKVAKPKKWKDLEKLHKKTHDNIGWSELSNDFYCLLNKELWILLNLHTGITGRWNRSDESLYVTAVDESDEEFAMLKIYYVRLVNVDNSKIDFYTRDTARMRYVDEYYGFSGFMENASAHIDYLNRYLEAGTKHALELTFKKVVATDV